MIAIINTGGDPKGVCTYTVGINRDVMTTFTHDRRDGLAECLLKAHQAVLAQNEKDTSEILIQLFGM